MLHPALAEQEALWVKSNALSCCWPVTKEALGGAAWEHQPCPESGKGWSRELTAIMKEKTEHLQSMRHTVSPGKA